jgi:2-polyprenyl-3-methyl-5-hydroxy-6-metoxy-1,4-benzoquinol methylase
MNLRDRERQYWDQLYQVKEYAYGTEPNSFLLAQVSSLLPGSKALVIGDGEGRNGVWLASQGLEVVSTDLSPHGVEKARLLAQKKGVSLALECCDLMTWPWPHSSFDVIVSIYVHFREPERSLIHRKIIDSLLPQGLFILEAFHSRHAIAIADPGLAECFYDSKSLRRDFGDLEIVTLTEGQITLDEGTMHQGPAEIVRMLAAKRKSPIS